MRILLDTHICIWLMLGSDRLSPFAAKLLEDSSNELYISTASIWEVAIKNKKHPDSFSITPEVLIDCCKKYGIERVDINDEHIVNIKNLKQKPDSPVHSDPFDRMILSQAIIEGVYLLTHDSKIASYEYEDIMLI